MRIGLRQITALCMSISIISTSVLAKVNATIEVDDANEKIVINGSFDNSVKDTVNVSIVKGKYDSDTFEELTEENIYKNLKYIKEVQSKNGLINFDICFNEPYGWYTVVLNTFDKDKIVRPVFFYRLDDVKELINNYNSFVSYDGTDYNETINRAENLVELMCSISNKDTFFESIKYFYNLSDSNKIRVATTLVHMPKVNYVTQIIKNLDTQSQLINLESILSSNYVDWQIVNFINDNIEYLQINDYTETKIFNYSNKDFKSRVVERLKNVQAQKFSYAFREAVILTQIESADNSGMISSILESAENSMKINIDVYKNYLKKSIIDEKIAQKNFVSLNELIKTINEIAAVNYKPENSSSKTSSQKNNSVFSKSPLDVAIDVNENDNKVNKDKIFSDIDSSHWAYNAICFLKNNSIIDGYEDNTFRPNSSITRAEFLKLIMCSLSIDNDVNEMHFLDVKQDSYFYKSVNAAAKYGIILGDENELFNPDEKITREDAAIILYRAAVLSGFIFVQKQIPVFNDESNIASYAIAPINILKNCGIIKGNDGYFNPKENASRAEMSQLIYAFLMAK